MDQTAKHHLRAQLTEHGLSLTRVASACGISQQAVSQWFAADDKQWRPIPAKYEATLRKLLSGEIVPAAPPARQRQRARRHDAIIHRLLSSGVAAQEAPSARFSAPPVLSPPPAAKSRPRADRIAARVNPATGPLHSDFVAEHNRTGGFLKPA